MKKIATSEGARRFLVGRTIVGVSGERVLTNFGTTVLNLRRLQLDDGSVIVLMDTPLENDTAIVAWRISAAERAG